MAVSLFLVDMNKRCGSVKVREIFSAAATSFGSIVIVMMITPALARDNSA